MNYDRKIFCKIASFFKYMDIHLFVVGQNVATAPILTYIITCTYVKAYSRLLEEMLFIYFAAK